MEHRYMKYFPDTVNELQEFQKLGEIEGAMLEEAAEARNELVDNQWILTAQRSGLLRTAKIMGFLGAETMGTEALRSEIQYRWNSRSPYTYFHLQDWLDGWCGADNYQAVLDREQYLLRLILKLNVKQKRDFVEKHLRRIIPANLRLEVDLNTNTHGNLKILTHGQMKKLGWTYGDIPFEDLTSYQK